MATGDATFQSSPEFWQSFSFVAGGIPEQHLGACDPILEALGLLALGPLRANPAHLLLSARRLAHGLTTISWFKAASESADQWEAEQRFGSGILALRAATDNCGHFLNELHRLQLSPHQIDLASARFRASVRGSDRTLAGDLDKLAEEVGPTTLYRHAVAHRAFPRVLYNADLKALVVPEDPTPLDPVEHFLDRERGATRPGVPAIEVLGDAADLARRVMAASARSCVRTLLAQGIKPPRQPSPSEFGRAALMLMQTGDLKRSDIGPVLHSYGEQAAKSYPATNEQP